MIGFHDVIEVLVGFSLGVVFMFFVAAVFHAMNNQK